MFPSEDGNELFVAVKTADDGLIGHPVLPGTDELPYRYFIIHYTHHNTLF